MHTVYILLSRTGGVIYYKGYTTNLTERIRAHNAGQVSATVNLRPWYCIFHCTFPDKFLALHFERYLKSGSGHAFMYKHLVEKNIHPER